jgi:aromatic ring-opening dioxygenase catalytic subunit (LigB family)
MNMKRAPVFFVSHAAPTFVLEPGRLGPRLGALGKQFSGVKAILVVSAHWQTRNVSVMTTAKPATAHDFGGFDPALYTLHYPAPGQPQLAAESASGEAGYAREFAGWTREVITAGQLDRLVAYRRLAPQAEHAHPTEEHSLPLLVAMGAHGPAEATHVIEGGITHGVLSMDSYAWGLEQALDPQSAHSAAALA